MKKFFILIPLLFLIGCATTPTRCMSGNCTTGTGTYEYSNGEKYVGEFKNGKRDGQGTFTSSNGNKYIGEFKNGKAEGQGTFTWFNGAKHVGEYKNGLLHGKGTFTWFNGDKYVGEYKNGKKDGQGTATFANGNKYIGEFKNELKHGQGTFYLNGEIYKGIWKKDYLEIDYNKKQRELAKEKKKETLKLKKIEKECLDLGFMKDTDNYRFCILDLKKSAEYENQISALKKQLEDQSNDIKKLKKRPLPKSRNLYQEEIDRINERIRQRNEMNRILNP